MSPAQAAWRMLSRIVLFSAVSVFATYLALRPRNARDWRSLAMFAAFVVSLFSEMFGVPLAMYLLSGWLSRGGPGADLSALGPGDRLEDRLGWHSTPRLDQRFPRAGAILILAGLALLWASWPVLYRARRDGKVATSGPYAWVRHPQYSALIAIMLGFLAQWPTLLVSALFLILAAAYVRLAGREERQARAEFGEAYDRYAARTPAFIPFQLRRDARH